VKHTSVTVHCASSVSEIRGGTIRVQGRDPIPVSHVALIVGRDEACDLVLNDKKVSAVHLELAASERGVRVRDLGSRNGTYVGRTRLADGYLVEPTTIIVGDTPLEFLPTRPERVELSDVIEFGPMVGRSQKMREVFARCQKAAPTDLSVLILGETGCGKELVAAAIHRASARRDKPFIVVDCGAIAPGLAESALFGHVKGAYTNAISDKLSPFVEADGGTIFLDELGELPLDIQPKLLRALAEQRIKAVGATKWRPVDVRVIAATRRDITREVNAGTFRSDLYFRVAQLRVELPALKDRLEDIPSLVRRISRDLGAPDAFERITNDSLERLMRHDWPGNVRELRNVLSVAIAFAKDGPIDLSSHIAPLFVPSEATPTKGRTYQDAKRELLTRFEHDYFTALYAECEGNVSEIGRRAAMERAHVRGYLRRHNIGAK
jgi:DNA-binding NtrC family response regulator